MQQPELHPSHTPQHVTGIFRVIEISQRQGRKRRAPYRVLTIENAGGAIRAFAHPEIRPVARGQQVRVAGHMRDRDGEVELLLTDLTPIVPEGDAAGKADVERLAALIREIADPAYQTLVRGLLEDPAFRARFCQAPASQHHHHAYAGGLLRHTVEVMEAAIRLFPMLPQPLDRDLLLSGACLHDIGKVETYGPSVPIQLTAAGRALGHELLGLQRVFRALETVPTLTPEAAGRLLATLLPLSGRPVSPEREAVTLLDSFSVGCSRLNGAPGLCPTVHGLPDAAASLHPVR